MTLLPHRRDDIGLIGHVICDYPTPDLCRSAMTVMRQKGVALTEVQIPCSEPIADGPLFMKANHEALHHGVKVRDVFALLPHEPDLPKVVMTYINIVFKFGIAEFVAKAHAAGARGFIIPDLPVEYADEFLENCQRHAMAWVPIVTPNMTLARMQEVLRKGSGFVYAVARSGVTGKKSKLDTTVTSYLQVIREHSDLPIGVGFGIATRNDLDELRPYADYAIIGSAAMRSLQAEGANGFASFWDSLI